MMSQENFDGKTKKEQGKEHKAWFMKSKHDEIRTQAKNKDIS